MAILVTLTDYITSQVLFSILLFSVLLCWSRLTTTRPLPPKHTPAHQVRTTTHVQTLFSNYQNAFTVYTWNCISSIVLLYFICTTEYTTRNANIQLTEFYWWYLLCTWLLLSSVWLVYQQRAYLDRIDSDTFIAILVVFNCICTYYLPTNLWTLVILLECQGMALLLILSTNEVTNKDTLQHTLTSLKQTANTNLARPTLLQFWVGFIGAALLLTAGALYVSLTGAAHWTDMVHLLVLHQQTTASPAWATSITALLLLSLLLKTGAFPMHFWKPEIYNNLRLLNVFIYATPYSVTITYAMLLILSVLMLAVPATLKWILWVIVLISTYILCPILFALTEIKAFLAYTSSIHVIYVYTAVMNDRHILSAASLYNLIYGCAALTLFTALLNFRRLSIKYLTDLQLYSHLPTAIFWLGTALATMSGVPPLLGFWAKFNILFNLWRAQDIILLLHLLSISMIYMYFYLALYRFTGATNFPSHPLRILQIAHTPVATVGIIATSLHLVGLWLISDLSNWTTWFAQNVCDYL